MKPLKLRGVGTVENLDSKLSTVELYFDRDITENEMNAIHEHMAKMKFDKHGPKEGDQWCPVHICWENLEQWNACDDELRMRQYEEDEERIDCAFFDRHANE